jgi:hypothetical protein
MLEFEADGPEFKTKVDISTCLSLLSCLAMVTHYECEKYQAYIKLKVSSDSSHSTTASTEGSLF